MRRLFLGLPVVVLCLSLLSSSDCLGGEEENVTWMQKATATLYTGAIVSKKVARELLCFPGKALWWASQNPTPIATAFLIGLICYKKVHGAALPEEDPLKMFKAFCPELSNFSALSELEGQNLRSLFEGMFEKLLPYDLIDREDICIGAADLIKVTSSSSQFESDKQCLSLGH